MEQNTFKKEQTEEIAGNLTTAKWSTKTLTRLSLLAGLGILLMAVVEVPLLPATPFLKYDPADIPILIGTLLYGPLAGVLLTIVVSFVQSFIVHGSSGVYGFLMHVIATGMMVAVAGLLFQNKKEEKSSKNLILALFFGGLIRVIGMFFANLIITPLFLNYPVSQVMILMPGIILFNVIKTGINVALTYFIYKKIVLTKLFR